MSWATTELIPLLNYLLPGFVAVAVFSSLTSHAKPSEFERIIQALIFTVLAQISTLAIKGTLLAVGARFETLGSWPENGDLVASILSATALGTLAAWAVNTDSAHALLRKIGVTREDSYPTEWYSAFSRNRDCYAVLHLEGERRLFCWPEEWPSDPKTGHFVVVDAEWLVGENERVPLPSVQAMLVPVGNVEMVEFVSLTNEAKAILRGEDGIEENLREGRDIPEA